MKSTPHLLYLHGFLSAPQSLKAQQTVEFCKASSQITEYTVPELSEGPAETIAYLKNWIEENQDKSIVLMGSSLGGYYATYLAEKYALPAVLINPAVRPYDLWQSHIGIHKNFYTDTLHEVTEKHIDELHDIDIKQFSIPQNYLVLVQTGDEVLDYKQAVKKFQQSRCIIHEGGNHSYENYVAELPIIFDFLLSRISLFAR